MTQREKEALEHGRIKLFLLPDEVAVLYSGLLHLLTELTVADKQLELLENKGFRDKVSNQRLRETLTALEPPIEVTLQSLVAQSLAHFNEIGESSRNEKLAELCNSWSEHVHVLKEIGDLATLASQASAYSLRDKK